MHWLRTTFRNYCLKYGVVLSDNDFVFIEKILRHLPENVHKSIMRGYLEEWLEWMPDDEKVSSARNLARLKANKWLKSRLD